MNECIPCKRVMQAVAKALAQLDTKSAQDHALVTQYIRMNSKFETLSRKVFEDIVIEVVEISDTVREVIVRVLKTVEHLAREIRQNIRFEWAGDRWIRATTSY